MPAIVRRERRSLFLASMVGSEEEGLGGCVVEVVTWDRFDERIRSGLFLGGKLVAETILGERDRGRVCRGTLLFADCGRDDGRSRSGCLAAAAAAFSSFSVGMDFATAAGRLAPPECLARFLASSASANVSCRDLRFIGGGSGWEVGRARKVAGIGEVEPGRGELGGVWSSIFGTRAEQRVRARRLKHGGVEGVSFPWDEDGGVGGVVGFEVLREA